MENVNVCRKFWMVLGSGNPVFHHESEQSAMKEAERLARQNRGSTFTVLEAVGTVTASDVMWREAVEDPEIPF